MECIFYIPRVDIIKEELYSFSQGLRSGPIVWVLDPDPSFLKNSDPAKMPQKEHTTAYFAYEILYFLQATIRNSFINLIY